MIRKKSYHARVDRVYGFTKIVRWTNVLKLQGKVLDEINVVLNEGHRTQFVQDMAYLQEAGMSEEENQESFLLENFTVASDEVQALISWYDMYEQFGENAIDSWNYCSALNLVSFYYLAGYYSEEEALDKPLEIYRPAE
ncbi:MAG: DUF1266 domain-containing protein [Lachnospiraceae bacterium]|nr:DUF1266 domain-containing protein [Lachnospiraceae bacterium]